MPAWRRTKLLPGLYDEPVSEHLQQEVAGFGSAAQLHAARTDETGIPALEAWLGEAPVQRGAGGGEVELVRIGDASRSKPVKAPQNITQPMNWRAIMAPSAFADGNRRCAAMEEPG